MLVGSIVTKRHFEILLEIYKYSEVDTEVRTLICEKFNISRENLANIIHKLTKKQLLKSYTIDDYIYYKPTITLPTDFDGGVILFQEL